MKSVLKLSLLLVLSVWVLCSHAQPVSFSLSVATNPPEGGTITGNGIYTNTEIADVHSLANPGWYISNVTFDGPPSVEVDGHIMLSPAEQFKKIVLVLDTGDVTTITDISSTVYMTDNSAVTAWFTPLSPTFAQQPNSQNVIAGSQATVVAQVNGRRPLSLQWQKDGQNLPTQTNANLVLNNIQLGNTGTYTLVASNAFGVSNSAPAVIMVKDLIVLTNGQAVAGGIVTADDQTAFTLQSRYPNGNIFYTLDGTEPDFNAIQYTGAFHLSKSCTFRAIAYSADFSQSVLGDSLTLVVIPTYELTIANYGGGNVIFTPNSGFAPGLFYPAQTARYRSNALVTVTVFPDSDWTFMGWAGALTGRSVSHTLTMNGPKYIEPTFGTTLDITASGHGTVSVKPAATLYPYGTTVEITALPDQTNYFGVWGNAASGSQNPLSHTVMSPKQTVSSLFAALPANKAALTVVNDGDGFVSLNPSLNRYTVGATVTLAAFPNGNQEFIGWTGDVISTTTPLSVVMNTSKVITAHFTRKSILTMQSIGTDLQLSLIGAHGSIYLIEASTNLSIWTPFTTVTNFDGMVRFYDRSMQSTPVRVFRAVAQ